jgi:hypothetical protein
MGYERFSAELFSCPFLVVRRSSPLLLGGSASPSMPPVPSDGTIFPESMSEILSFNPVRVVRQFQSAPIMKPTRVSGKKMSVILIRVGTIGFGALRLSLLDLAVKFVSA